MTPQAESRLRGWFAYRVPLRVGVVVLATAMVAGFCGPRLWAPWDRLIHLDWIDVSRGQIAEGPPGRPLIMAGPDGLLGTADDIVLEYLFGDLDLVLRAGRIDFAGPIPQPIPHLYSAPAPNGLGSEIDFVVSAVDGSLPSPLDAAIFSPSIEGNPLLIVGFADLDDDGRIGPTLTDGDPFDLEIEEAELEPVAMQMVTVENGRASGRLRLLVGGPAEKPTKILIAAAVISGATDPGQFGGAVPIGPSLMTALPFYPPFSPDGYLDAGPAGPEPATPDRPLGIEIKPAFDPDPLDPSWGERFALKVDGSEVSVDVVSAHSGTVSRFGVAISARTTQYSAEPARPVRGGVDELGNSHPFEVASRLFIADDGEASALETHIVPLDRLGNITDLSASKIVTVSTGGIVAILDPDLDGDPYTEDVVVSGAEGALILLGDTGGLFDDPLVDWLGVNGSAYGGSIVELLLPDSDVNDSGLVDEFDLQEVESRRGTRLDDLNFEPRLDLDGNGRIDERDEDLVTADLTSVIAIP